MSASVLFVDDEAPVRLANTQTLELAGFAVQAAESAEEALAAISADFPGVVVCDVRLPGIDGLTLLRKVRAIDPELPVVLVTGHGEVAMAVEAMRDGAHDFIEKPYPAERLVEIVQRASGLRRLVLENRALRAELDAQRRRSEAIIGRSPAIERLRRLIDTLAPSDVDVLILGETGTGKELVAQTLHRASRRSAGPFVALNCGALPETLIESELFGHEAGTFTSATRRRTGRVVHASGGTLFLDEIESMPLLLQVKLLRVLQERAVDPLGTNKPVPVDIRVLAATKLDLKVLADEGRFRADLYYRLNVATLHVPPLRERAEDVPLLFEHFRDEAERRLGRAPPPRDAGLFASWMARPWPGNVRELKHAVERFVLGLDEAPVEGALSLAARVDAFERSLIADALARHRGNVKAAVDALGLPRKTLYDKLRKHAIDPDTYR